MAERRRTVDIVDFAGKHRVTCTDEHIAQIEACIWIPRPFKLVYENGSTQMFSRVIRVWVSKHNIDNDNAVRYVLLPRDPEA